MLKERDLVVGFKFIYDAPLNSSSICTAARGAAICEILKVNSYNARCKGFNLNGDYTGETLHVRKENIYKWGKPLKTTLELIDELVL